ncbi:type III secretion system YopN/LcrE/InvE/MxiC family regulator [Breoghania corrubedonensis]|uniref:Type III secretion system YopN/LcrE/InvE/MxiC family regulator n=1 Tax=Breoghania corrubedonensis TaxID=665038 RepID=A0A2T5UYS9_9HYPH|nr:HrpJ domain-containing protein [Breoghania corrubedonensis]PTW56665.1 type III secretion system YopN/LcrE/InvE/MxiC family regulator [Breoghania corrubedonensis]
MAEINLLRQQVASGNVQSTVGAEVLEQARGAQKGNSAAASVINNDLSDIQEEIGNAAAHLKDKRSLGQTKLRQGQGANREALKRIADYYDKLPDKPHEDDLRDLVKTLQKFEDILEKGGGSGQHVSADDILHALRDFDKDVTHQYEVLRAVIRYHEDTRAAFENGGPSPERAAAREALRAELDAAEARFEQDPDLIRDVRAGYAMAALANDAAPTLETNPAALRNHYREMLRGPRNMAQIFDTLTGFNLRFAFDAVVDLFMDAAGNDLASTTTSTDPVLLGALLKELSKLKTMRTVFGACHEALAKVQRIDHGFANGAGAGGPEELASALLHFCTKHATNLADARALAKPFETDFPPTMVVFANELRDLHAMVPDQVFPSDQACVQQKKVLEQLQTEMTEIEEQFFEAQNAPD